MNVNLDETTRIFIDTNVWIYLYSKDQPGKQAQVKRLIEQASFITISTQVLNELINVFMKKYKLRVSVIEKILNEIIVVAEVALIDKAIIKNRTYANLK
jgi:predicted nucleic acid-binding protein